MVSTEGKIQAYFQLRKEDQFCLNLNNWDKSALNEFKKSTGLPSMTASNNALAQKIVNVLITDVLRI